MRSPRRRWIPPLLAASLLLAAGCRRHHDSDKVSWSFSSKPLVPVFADATGESGVAFTSLPRGDAAGYGQGAAAADIDGDGDLDLFLTQDDGPCALYRNDGGLRFTKVAAAAGVLVDPVAAHAKAAAFLDYDRDGDPDLFVGTAGSGNRLFRNRGDGTFEDATAEAGVGGGGDFTVSAAVGDFDGDGYPDLYLCNFAATDYGSPLQHTGSPAPNRLLRNRGDGTFAEEAALRGVDDPLATWAALWLDVDGDGDQDLLVANDAFFYPEEETRDRVFVNGGAPDFRFEDRAADFGLDESHFGMGFAVGDLDGDGLPDLYVSDLGDNELRLGGDPLPWPDRAPALGVQSGGTTPSDRLVSWGAAIVDLDADGRRDLLVVNGTLASEVPGPGFLQRQPPALYLARPDRGAAAAASPVPGVLFPDHAEAAGLKALGLGGARCVLPCDLDGDGDFDLVVSTRVGDARVLRNDTPLRSRWYGVRLRGTESTTEGLGARLELRVGGATLVDLVTTGGQCGGSLAPEVLFHPGPRARGPARLTVRWPSGRVSEVHPLPNAWTTVAE